MDAFENHPAATALLDHSGGLLRANASLRRLAAELGIEDMRGVASLGDLFPGEAFAASFSAALRKVAGGGRAEAAAETGGSASRSFSVDLNPGSLAGSAFVAVLRETTEQARRERKLERGQERAERAEAAKGMFLASMSHEIRTPIQTILSLMELLEDTGLDRAQADYLAQARYAADSLLSLVSDVLDYSRIEAGKLEAEAVPFDPEAALEQAALPLAIEAHRKGLELVLAVDPLLPSLATGDPTRTRQVLINFVKNAIKFTHTGRIRASAAVRGGELLFEVADTGIGVAEQDRPKLFKLFSQVDGKATRRYGGTGLGLAISKDLAGLLGGAIGYRDEGGRGSAFWLSLPLRDPGPPRELRPFSGRALVAEDCAEAAEEAVAMLGRHGMGAERRADGASTLAELAEAAAAGRPYDLCLIDTTLPDTDGWRLAAEINSRPEINSVRIVMATPLGRISQDTRMGLLKWSNAQVDKPLTRRKLEEALARAMETAVDLESAPEEEAPPVYRARALVAEDHPVNQELFRTMLARYGIESVGAFDGEQAVWLAGSERVDIVFMDIQMPLLDGYEATRIIRTQLPLVPIVAVTASALAGERERCRRAGMDDVISKPFKRAELERILRERIGDLLDGATRDAATRDAALLAATAPTRSSRPPRERPDGERGGAAAAASGDKETFDGAMALDRFLGDAEALGQALRIFARRTGDSLAEIARSCAAGDLARAASEAHSIKGSALNLEARRLAQRALDLERAAKGGDAQAAAMARVALDAAYAEFRTMAED